MGCAILLLILLIISLFADLVSLSEWFSKLASQGVDLSKQVINPQAIAYPLPKGLRSLTVGDIYKTVGNDNRNEIDIWIKYRNNTDAGRRDHAQNGLQYTLETEKKRNNNASSMIATLLGYQYLEQGNIQEATKYLQYAHDANPENIFAPLLLYSAYKKERDILTQKAPSILDDYSNAQFAQNRGELTKILVRQEELRQLMEKLEQKIEKCLQKFSSTYLLPSLQNTTSSVMSRADNISSGQQDLSFDDIFPVSLIDSLAYEDDTNLFIPYNLHASLPIEFERSETEKDDKTTTSSSDLTGECEKECQSTRGNNSIDNKILVSIYEAREKWNSPKNWDSPSGFEFDLTLSFQRQRESSQFGGWYAESRGASTSDLFYSQWLSSGHHHISKAQEGVLSWSPGDSNLTFVSERGGHNAIYIMNADGSNLIQLTSTSAQKVVPYWSPDESWIAFASSREGPHHISMMNFGGSNLTRGITSTAMASPGSILVENFSGLFGGYFSSSDEARGRHCDSATLRVKRRGPVVMDLADSRAFLARNLFSNDIKSYNDDELFYSILCMKNNLHHRSLSYSSLAMMTKNRVDSVKTGAPVFTLSELDISVFAQAKAGALLSQLSSVDSRGLPFGMASVLYTNMARRIMDEMLSSSLTVNVTGIPSKNVKSITINGISAVLKDGRFFAKNVPVLLSGIEPTSSRSVSEIVAVPWLTEDSWKNFTQLWSMGNSLFYSQLCEDRPQSGHRPLYVFRRGDRDAGASSTDSKIAEYVFRRGDRDAGASSTDSKIAENIKHGF